MSTTIKSPFTLLSQYRDGTTIHTNLESRVRFSPARDTLLEDSEITLEDNGRVTLTGKALVHDFFWDYSNTEMDPVKAAATYFPDDYVLVKKKRFFFFGEVREVAQLPVARWIERRERVPMKISLSRAEVVQEG